MCYVGLCVIDIYSEYAWVIPLKDRKGITITNAFQKILNESNHKPNKIRVDKGSEFYNRSVRSIFQNNDMKMFSVHNEGKFVIAERFIRTVKNKISKCTVSVSKNVHNHKLDNVVNKYNNTYHSTIKLKAAGLKRNTIY